jgi:hypothetical protein
VQSVGHFCVVMAMHYRRHNPPAGGANPFTGRSLPNGRSSAGGAGGRGGDHYHGNTPSPLVSNMTKKAVFLVLTFTIFFYVIFSPEYDDGSYETNQTPTIKKEENKQDALNKSFVDLSKKPQSEPVKLKLPSEITPDHDNSESGKEEEKEVDSADYVDKRTEEEDEEGGMAYNYKDRDEQSKDEFGQEDNASNDDAAEAEEQLSPAEKVYNGALVHVDETEGDEETLKFDPFLGLDKSEENENEEEEEESALDNGRGGLRGSKSASKNPFGRQEKPDDDEKEEEGEEDLAVESSGDGSEAIDEDKTYEDKTFFENQSPLEVPNSVAEDESTKSKEEKNIEDASEQGVDTETAVKPCQDDPKFRYKDQDGQNCEYVSDREKCNRLHNGEKVGIVSCPVSCSMVDDCLTRSHVAIKKDEQKTFDEEDSSEGFSSKEKAAFEAKYGSVHKSMEDEANEQDALDRGVFKNQPPLEVPVVDASDVVKHNQTEVGQTMEKKSGGLSMEEDVNEHTKSMADELDKEEKDSGTEDLIVKKAEELDKEEKDSGDEDLIVKKTEDLGDDVDAEEEKTANDEDYDEDNDEPSESGDAGEDSKVNKAASSVQDNFKEYLITNSEDEPKKDVKSTEDREDPLDESKDDKPTLDVKDENISKVDESEESVVVKEKVEDTDETVKKGEESNNAAEQGDEAGEDSSVKKTSSIRGAADDKSKKDSQEVEEDLGDDEVISSPKKVQTNESVAEEEKVEDTDETGKRDEGSNNAAEQGGEVDEESSAKKTSSIRGAADDKSKKDSQEVEKDLGDDEFISSPKKVQTSAEEENVEDSDETMKKSEGSNNTPEQVDEADEESSAKSLIRGAVDEKSKNASQEVKQDLDGNADSIFEERKETTADKSIKRGGDSSDQGDNASEESNINIPDHGDSKDVSQEVAIDLNDSQALSKNGNETTSQINKSEEASKSVDEARGSGGDEEQGDADEGSQGKKGTSFGSGLGDSIKESDAEKVTEDIETDFGHSKDAKARKFDKSKVKADESTKKNKDKKSSDNLADASKEFKQDDESELPEKVEDDIKYAKIVNESKEPAENEDGSVEKENGGKGKAMEGESEDSPIDKDDKLIRIQGDLGEAIKESDAPVNDEETATDNNDVVRSSNTEVKVTQEIPDEKDDEDDKSAEQGENDEEGGELKEEVNEAADTEESIVGKDTTAKINREREEKE